MTHRHAFATLILAAALSLGTLNVVNAEKRYCKEMESCAEAVESWCSGHSDRDRDGDGIPCENICRSRQQTLAEQALIGCTL